VLHSTKFIFIASWVSLHKSSLRYSAMKSLPVSLQVGKSGRLADGAFVEWHDNRREISVRGKFYDVLECRQDGDGWTVVAVEDIAESSWLSFADDKDSPVPALVKLAGGDSHYNLPAVPCLAPQSPSKQLRAPHLPCSLCSGTPSGSWHPPRLPFC
jgi:hypothetical protein